MAQPPRRDRRANAVGRVLQLQPADGHAVFDQGDRAPPHLEHQIVERLFSVQAAASTLGFNIPPQHIGAPPARNPGVDDNVDYEFQQDMPGPARHQSWDWISRHSTFFYRPPHGAANTNPFYLRVRDNSLGVDNNLWARLFPYLNRRHYYRTFRTFHLLEAPLGDPVPDFENSVYFEVDLASRAPDHTIDVSVDEDDSLDDVRVLAWLEKDNIMHPHDEPVEPLEDNPLGVLVAVLTQIIYTLIRTDVFELLQHRAVFVLAYETYSSDQDQMIILSESVDWIYHEDDDANELMDAVVDALIDLVWNASRYILQPHYEENGVFVFHPRLFRVVIDNNMPEEQGQLYLRPPQGLRMVRGGCMSVTGLPLSLLNELDGLAISHDVFRPNTFFDNNCGIREGLVAMIGRPNSEKELKDLFVLAAALRFETPQLPPFIKLSPQQVYQVLQHYNNGEPIACHVLVLPTPEEPKGRLITTHHEDINPDEVDHTKQACLVYVDGHYFGVNAYTAEEITEKFKALCSIRYCRRCMKYCKKGDGRISHDFEEAQHMYPSCKPRKVVRNIQEYLDQEMVGGADIEKNPLKRTLPKMKPTPFMFQTQDHHVGFMDFETYRPQNYHGYHEVYAVGWIKTCSPNISTQDVKLYSSCSDRFTCNAALVGAFVDLIAFISSKPTVYTKKNPYYLYFYNGSRFDNLFVLHSLATHFELNPDDMTLKDGQLMTMSYLEGALVIRDLCLMTLCSLKQACKIYHVEDKLAKGDFDHNAIKSLNDVERLWPKISEYLAKDLTALNMVYIGFRDTAYKVFHLDPCPRITLSHLSYDYWNTNLTVAQRDKVILPRSYDIYIDMQKGYYGGRVACHVKEWTSEDFYKAYNEMDDYLVDLDIVSLYPSVMLFCLIITTLFFPLTKRNIPHYFCGDPILVVNDDSNYDKSTFFQGLFTCLDPAHHLFRSPAMSSMDYWGCYFPVIEHGDYAYDHKTQGALICVDFEPPQDLMMCLLPHKNDKGQTDWDLKPHQQQWYVLEEVMDAVWYGYKVTNIHAMYIFPHREPLFDSTMTTLMEGKKNCQRGDPKRDQYKGGANSIYGKHAQKAITENCKIIRSDELHDFMKSHYVIALEPITSEENVLELRRARMEREQFVNNDMDMVENYMIPVPAFKVTYKPKEIKASKPTYLGCQVTAYARIHMNWFFDKLNLLRHTTVSHQIFYSDTDSFVVHRHIQDLAPHGLFGKELGQADDELEGGKIVDFVGLAPKTYIITYKMPDGKLWMKIRAKGFPHTKDKLQYDCSELDLTQHPLPAGFAETEPGKVELLPETLDLGQRVYEIETFMGIKHYYSHLNPAIYRDILYRRIKSMTVYFTSMQAQFFSAHALGHVSGIKHAYMHRALTGAPWWDGTDGEPLHRKEVEGFEGVTFPIGHLFLQ